MRFILGLIIGAALAVLGAYVHDRSATGSAKPLVNWENAADLENTTLAYLTAQFDRVVKWATSK